MFKITVPHWLVRFEFDSGECTQYAFDSLIEAQGCLYYQLWHYGQYHLHPTITFKFVPYP